MADKEMAVHPILDGFHQNLSLTWINGPYFSQPESGEYRATDCYFPVTLESVFNLGDKWMLSLEGSVGYIHTGYDRISGIEIVESRGASGMGASAGLSFGHIEVPPELIVEIAAGWRGLDLVGKGNAAHSIYVQPQIELHPCGYRAFIAIGMGGSYVPEEENAGFQMQIGGGYTFF
ncbi:MAG: hypothetical protein ABH871_06665 [Pseudomonadota bacterium]